MGAVDSADGETQPMKIVHHILDGARKRLAVLHQEAPVPDAAAILANPNTPLIVVCSANGIAVGVVAKTDIMKSLAGSGTDSFRLQTGAIMTSPVVSCHVDQTLQRVWATMNTASLRSIPVLDDTGLPLGVVHARDLAGALLDEVTDEEMVLRDYVLGVGYQ
jgi:CBS domain-containing protein